MDFKLKCRDLKMLLHFIMFPNYKENKTQFCRKPVFSKIPSFNFLYNMSS